MNKSAANYINQLINDSGLIHPKNNSKKNYPYLNFSNETILITGAAGSIGSELTKQLMHCDFKKLILIDIAESPLYELQQELEHDENKVEFILANITDKPSLEYLFKTYGPTVVFHTAAYKHVPLMEANPYEAVKLNIIGTKLLADLAIKNAVNKFIFISTDKAVNPVSVMGMTKSIAERHLIFLNKHVKTKFIITRFGNVFGSNGSVVPLFINQINTGIPLTVTNKEMTRYFICKQKACHLILEIAKFKNFDPPVFTFNMGNPIKIIDLAKTLVAYYDEEAPIIITKIRPGEKLNEDIISDEEILIETHHNDIFQVKAKSRNPLKPINFDELLAIVPTQSAIEIKEKLKTYL